MAKSLKKAYKKQVKKRKRYCTCSQCNTTFIDDMPRSYGYRLCPYCGGLLMKDFNGEVLEESNV